MINGFTSLVVIAMFIEAFITYIQTIYKEHRIQWQVVLAFIVAGVLCYNTDLNLFQVAGLTEKYPIIGIIATALVLCRGSNYFFEFYKQLSSWRNANPSGFEDIKDDLVLPSYDSLLEPKNEIEQEDVKVANR